MFVVEELNNIEKYKKTKVKVLSSEILVAIPGKLGRKHFKTYLGLIDSGTSSCLVDKHLVSIHGLDANATPTKEKWLTQCGVFKTTARVTLDKMKLPQLTTKITVTAEINLFERAKEDPYDFILGQNFLQDIKLDIKSSTHTFAWDEIEIPMVPRIHWNKTSVGNFWEINIENKNREQVTNFKRKLRPTTEEYILGHGTCRPCGTVDSRL